MPASDTPLTRERVLATAEEVIRRFGPAKATVVDVARALGVSHAAVYRHVATKAELQDLVVMRWMDANTRELRAIAAETGPAPERLRRYFDALVAIKRQRQLDDPELFTTYRTLAAATKTVTAEHIQELVDLSESIIRAGVAEGLLVADDPAAVAQAVFHATSRFHHPAHVAEWADPAIEQAYEALWQLLMRGLTPRASAG